MLAGIDGVTAIRQLDEDPDSAVLPVPRAERVGGENACSAHAVADDLPQRDQLLHVVVGHRLPWRISQFVSEILDFARRSFPADVSWPASVEQMPCAQRLDRFIPLLLAPPAQPPREFADRSRFPLRRG